MSLGTPPLHRNLKIVLLMAAAAALTMLLSQCRMVTDSIAPVAGVSLAASAKTQDCLNNCQAQSNAAKDAEQKLHQANVKACKNDPVCLANEDARHMAAMDAINAARNACMDACHHQGSGTGGN